MYAVSAGGIGARGDDAARLGSPAHGERLTDQGRIALFFNCAKKGIQVQVENLAAQGFGIEAVMG